ncbi:MAG: glycosyltransferase [Rhizobiales bacterium]|nr:glycosyltransferase [Hyphomicrobiales bacterium]
MLPVPDTSPALGAKVLEIGTFPFFAEAFPADTTYLHIGYRGQFVAAEGRRLLSLASWPATLKLLRSGAYDFVVVNPTRVPPWSPTRFLRSLVNRHTLRGDFAGFRNFGQLLPLLGNRPLAVMDFDDSFLLSRHHEMLLGRALRYFKRELPVDRWHLFTGRMVNGIPSTHFRESRRRQALLDRIRPVCIGLRRGNPLAAIPAPREKKVDLFYRGRVSGRSTHRLTGLAEIKALAATGISVDASEDSMPFDAFMARMAEARLVWSPEGLGWDCFRHYEAAAAWSVPLINMPTIERHAPLEDGKHCIFYDVSAGDMAARIRAALADPARLARMAAAARAHVEENATPTAICRYMAEEMRRAAAPRAGKT